MPKQHRWTIKRNLRQAQNNINHAINNVVIAGHEFEDFHPEHYEAFSLIAANLDRIKTAVGDLEDLI